MTCFVSQSNKLKLSVEWVIDSGCTYHACTDRSQFTSFQPKRQSITLADGSVIQSSGRGTVDGFTEVNYVPEFKFNLLSVRCLTKIGYTVAFPQDGNVILIKDDTKTILGHHERGMFVTSPQAGNKISTSLITDYPQHLIKTIAPHDLLHQRWGHAYYQRLLTAQNLKLINGINHRVKPINFCDACAKAKSHMTPSTRTPGVQTHEKNTIPMSKILCDISGIIHIQGYKNVRYFILFMDDATYYMWIYFLTQLQEETILKIMDQFSDEITSGRYTVNELFVTKKFKLDCAAQFTSQDFKSYIKTKFKAKLEFAAPHSHYQNGRVERGIRTVREMGMSIMIHAKVPKFLYPFEFRHAVYLSNQLPTRTLDNLSTPYVLLFKRTPDEKHLRVFGCDAYAMLYDTERKKHGPRAKQGIYVGQPYESTGYLFYNPETRTVTTTNHIMFNENVNVTREWNIQDEESLLSEMNLSKEEEDKVKDMPSTPNTPREEEMQHDQRQCSTRTGASYNLRHCQFALLSGEYTPANEEIIALVENTSDLKIDQAMASPEKINWKGALYNEMESMYSNKVTEVLSAKDIPS